MALLEVTDLSVGYRTGNGTLWAVEGVSFSLEEGRSLGFVGESGCGKTTLGMALMGLLPPNATTPGGQIRFAGRDLLTLPEEQLRRVRWAEISMVFQAAMNALNPVRRIYDQIAEAIRTHEPEASASAVCERIEGLYQFVGLPIGRMHDYPHQYSGGMKQRAVIAMALACQPRLLIADEPTTALDVIVQDQILQEIRSLQRELGISLIFISHDISVVADLCHDIGVMYGGHLVEYGPREGVFDRPAHPYTRALVSSFPTLCGDHTDLKPIAGDPPDLHEPPPGCRFAPRCPLAVPDCTAREPGWTELGGGHRVRCPLGVP